MSLQAAIKAIHEVFDDEQALYDAQTVELLKLFCLIMVWLQRGYPPNRKEEL